MTFLNVFIPTYGKDCWARVSVGKKKLCRANLLIKPGMMLAAKMLPVKGLIRENNLAHCCIQESHCLWLQGVSTILLIQEIRKVHKGPGMGEAYAGCFTLVSHQWTVKESQKSLLDWNLEASWLMIFSLSMPSTQNPGQLQVQFASGLRSVTEKLLHRLSLKWSPQTKSISIIWGLVRKPEPQTSPQTYWIKIHI